MKLNKTALGLACGILWAATILIATVWTHARGGGGQHLVLLSRFYIGYSVSYTGAVIGMIYAFIGGFIGGWIVAWLYNLFAGKGQAA